MSKRETIPESEKRRQTFSSRNSPGSDNPPKEDNPEQDIAPEFEGTPLEVEGETQEVLTRPTRDSITKIKRKPKNQ